MTLIMSLILILMLSILLVLHLYNLILMGVDDIPIA